MSVAPRDQVSVHQVAAGLGNVHVADFAGSEPALVLMHGFPDDSRIYDRLVPRLTGRRTVTFDFLGYGRSDRPNPSALDPSDHVNQLQAVLDTVAINKATLVAHDASGPVAIDFGVAAPERVARLVLLNTYFGHAPTLHFPEMIRLFADPELTALADAMVDDQNQRLWLLQHTARQFGADPLDPNGVGLVSVFAQFFGGPDQPDALSAIRAWTAALFDSLLVQDNSISQGRLANLGVPVTLAFGAIDQYLNPDLARHLTGLFRHAELRLIDSASHWPQWDQPHIVAGIIR